MPNPSALSAQVLLAALLVAAVAAQIACVLEHCALALAECEADATCRTWSTCNRGAADLSCQLRSPTCTNRRTRRRQRSISSQSASSPSITAYRRSRKVPASRGIGSGEEIRPVRVADGRLVHRSDLNPHFDCFDCQLHTFKYDPSVAPRNKPSTVTSNTM